MQILSIYPRCIQQNLPKFPLNYNSGSSEVQLQYTNAFVLMKYNSQATLPQNSKFTDFF